MIAHEAKPHQPHGHFFVCLSHQFDESEEVIRLVKNIIATVTAIKNVVNKTALRCSGCAWHSITTTTLATQLKYNVPFLRFHVGAIPVSVKSPMSFHKSSVSTVHSLGAASRTEIAAQPVVFGPAM